MDALASENFFVIFIETKRAVYGGQKQLLARCGEFDRRGIPYAVIHPFCTSLFVAEYAALDLQGDLIRPSPRSGGRLASDNALSKVGRSVFILRTLAQLIRQRRGRVVIHSDAFDSAYLVSIASRVPGVMPDRVVKVFSVNSDRYRFFSRLDQTLLPAQDRLCTNSEFSRAQLRRHEWLSAFDISVCYSAIDFDALDAVLRRVPPGTAGRPDKVSIGYIGSFDRRKQLDQFARCAIAALQAIGSRFELEFTVFGDAKDADQAAFAEEVKRDIASSGFGAQITFAGYCVPEEVVSRVDALLCPFRFEPFGRVVPEFLYLGLDVFVIRDGGLTEAGCGFARELDALEGLALERQFVAALSEWLVEPPHSTQALADRREKLRAAFGSAAIVDRELQSYVKR
ncbi:glycosyltransferase family 4 protein [Salinisphaera hydrothermalis]|uniref:glycosyltransferase family 4 protein n=1 Tax=Salinisphaera hydrothermalis TaxID=563188 RepID=UPI00333FC5DB